ncbi:MAG: BamA/TamA family outer membrane protein [Candidatus Eisenbacteria bacterium]|nr:BamA/TamA family outer membrane protein [Candidatus Eisenbacteria bacterium]
MKRLFIILVPLLSCGVLSRDPIRFPAEHLVHQLDIADQGVLRNADVAREAMLVMVPGEVFDHYEWTKDKDRILAFYHSRGFHRARLDTVEAYIERTGIRLFYSIDPGPELTIRSLSVRGSWAVRAPKLVELLDLPPGSRMDKTRLELGKGRIRAALAAEGNVHATAASAIAIDGNDAALSITVEDGPIATVGEINVNGLRELKPSVAMRAVRLTPGRVFRPQDVYDTQRSLLATGLFSSVRILVPGMESREDTLLVFIHLREAPSRFVESGVGYVSPDRSALSLAVGHQDLWGVAASTRLGLGIEHGWVTDRRQYTAEGSFFYPWVVGLPFDAGLTLDYSWRSDPSARSEGFGTSIELGRSWRERASALCRYGYRWRKTNIEGDDPSEYVLEESRRPITNSLSAIVSIDTRTSFTDPAGGQLVRFQAAHAGGILGGDWSFRKAVADVSVYQRARGVILALRASTGVIHPLDDSPTAPEAERFRAGGANTVRGFGEEGLGPVDNSGNPLGGEAIVLLSVEARVPIWGYVGAALFTDCGQVWERARQIRLADLEPTLGCGVRYSTVIGPVRLDWGVPIRDRRVGRIHFTLGHAF